MTRLAILLAAAASAAGCNEDPVTFADAAAIDAATDAATDAPAEARCGDGIRVPGELCFEAGPQHLVTENAPHDAQAADLDGDGDLDIFYLAGGELRYHANTGAGVFATAFTAGFARYGNHLAARDLDGDARADLAIGDWDELSMWRSNGVAPATHQLVGALTLPGGDRSVAFADVDGDGAVEVVTIDGARLEVGQLDAALVLTAGTGMELGAAPDFLDVGRLDGDASDDLLLAGGYGVRVVLGGVSGPQPPTSYPLEGAADGVAAGDVDGDGRVDAYFFNGGGMGFMRGNGDGTLEEPVLIDVDASVSDLAVGDFDGDGRDDAVLLTTTAELIFYLAQTGTLVEHSRMKASAWADGFHITADLDGDGAPDLVLNDGESQLVSVLRSDP